MTTVEIDGRGVRLTNLDKVLWPETGTTKAELIDYYVSIAPVLLPHLAGRPVTIRRFPDGIGGINWHQNECQGEPDWFPVYETTGRRGRPLRFCMVDGLPELVWLANKAVVELHPFLWRVDAPRVPTQIVFDLDPGAPAGLVDSARVALMLHDELEDLGLTPFVKTSGSLGLHVHAPLPEPGDVKREARAIAEQLAKRRPDEVVAEMRRSARPGKVFVDWLQNDPGRQTVSPYSLRGVELPLVATPVSWDEVERAVAEHRADRLVFTARDVLERVRRDGDLFAALQ